MPLSYRVEDKMRLSKHKTAMRVNPTLTLAGIPPRTFSSRLGNRSAVEWVIHPHQINEDRRSGIRFEPHGRRRMHRAVGRHVVRVSLQTVRIVDGIPRDYSE